MDRAAAFHVELSYGSEVAHATATSHLLLSLTTHRFVKRPESTPYGGQSEAVSGAYDQHTMGQLLCKLLGHHRGSVRTVMGIEVRVCGRCGRAR
ncbi:MAG: hypothetical protein QOF45_885 [Gaiellaceae bacterium]|nr:hypothetical protein [Gaiellaceae bacterium]